MDPRRGVSEASSVILVHVFLRCSFVASPCGDYYISDTHACVRGLVPRQKRIQKQNGVVMDTLKYIHEEMTSQYDRPVVLHEMASRTLFSQLTAVPHFDTRYTFVPQYLQQLL